MGKYLTNFTSRADVISSYGAPADALKDAVIHLAWYGDGGYCGGSLVVFEKNGKLYEVNGSHCSCYGLEGQWEPEETTWKALDMRNLGGYDGSGEAEEILHRLTRRMLKASEPQLPSEEKKS